MRRGVGAGRLHRHLLAQHDAQRQFGLVDGARDALSGCLRDQRTQIRVGAERVDDGLGVGVEVQQAPAAGDRGGQVPEVVQHQRAPHVIGFRCEADDSVAGGQPQGPPVRAVAHLLHARHRARGEVAEQSLVRERRADRKPQRQRARGDGFAAAELGSAPDGAARLA